MKKITDISSGIGDILNIESTSPTVLEILEFIGDSFRAPEVYGILQTICYRNGIDPQDFMSAMDDVLVKLGFNGE